MKKWEYFIYETGYSKDLQQSNLIEFGSNGWELVSVIKPEVHNHNNFTYYFFKREILENNGVPF